MAARWLCLDVDGRGVLSPPPRSAQSDVNLTLEGCVDTTAPHTRVWGDSRAADVPGCSPWRVDASLLRTTPWIVGRGLACGLSWPSRDACVGTGIARHTRKARLTQCTSLRRWGWGVPPRLMALAAQRAVAWSGRSGWLGSNGRAWDGAWRATRRRALRGVWRSIQHTAKRQWRETSCATRQARLNKYTCITGRAGERSCPSLHRGPP
jgi:hypothetical protein